jgi:hypothetical protein
MRTETAAFRGLPRKPTVNVHCVWWSLERFKVCLDIVMRNCAIFGIVYFNDYSSIRSLIKRAVGMIRVVMDIISDAFILCNIQYNCLNPFQADPVCSKFPDNISDP